VKKQRCTYREMRRFLAFLREYSQTLSLPPTCSELKLGEQLRNELWPS
jgi:hypothetical protein